MSPAEAGKDGVKELLKLTRLLLDQRSDFSLIGKSPSFNVLFGVDQLTVALYIKNTAAAFDQFDI
jgi:hypothetical protein